MTTSNNSPTLATQCLALLRTNPLFGALGNQDLTSMANAATLDSFSPRKVVCRRGDPGTTFYLVLDGKLKVGDQCENGREIIYRLLGPGDSFGEIALLDGSGRSATVTATEPSRLFTIRRDVFLGTIGRNPDVYRDILVATLRRLRDLTDQVECWGSGELHRRLAKTLQILTRLHGESQANGLSTGLAVSKTELAAMVGASREAVSRILVPWEDSGVITIEDGVIVILQPKVLFGNDC